MGFLRSIAEKSARSEGHEQLAAQRGLSYQTVADGEALPKTTPLLRSARGANYAHLMQGKLAEGIQGYAAIMTHNRPEVGEGHGTDTTFHQIVLTGAAAAAEFIPQLVVGSRTHWEPPRNEGLRYIHTVSSEVEKRYWVGLGPETDENRVRQLLSPVMIEWLASVDISGFGFELDHGWLCVYSPPSVYIPFVTPGKPEELAWLMDTAGGLAARILAEAAE